MMVRLCLFAAALLAPLSAWANEAAPVLAIAPFSDGGNGELGRRIAGALVHQLVQSRYVLVREEQELQRVLEQTVRQSSSPELFGSAAASVQVGQAAAADYIVVGQVGLDHEDTYIQARCVDIRTHTVVPGTAMSVRSRDWESLAYNIAEVFHVKLTGGYPLGLERDDRMVRNDTSDVTLTVELDRKGETGRLPVYIRNELMRFSVDASVAGYLSIIGVGKEDVYQLFPVGPVGAMDTAVAPGRPVSLPTPQYRDFDYDPNGFQLYGDTPGIERIHVFFCRQPITLMVPDSQLNPAARQMTPSEYYEDFLPRLKQHLTSKDRLWNGTTVRYYYGVDDALLEHRTARADAIEVAPDDPNSALTQDRGPEIEVDNVVGVWPIENGDLEAAKEGALIDARRNALEQALGVMVSSETVVEQFQLVRDSIEVKTQTGFVRVKEVVEESQREDHFLVRINALVTSNPVVSMLRDTAALQQLWADLSHPRIICLVTDEIVHGGQPMALDGQFSYATQQLIRHLTDAGLTVLEPSQLNQLAERDKVQQAMQGNAEAAAYIANALQSDLVILGRARASVMPTETLTPVEGSIDVSVVSAADASILVQSSASMIGHYQERDAVQCGRQCLVGVVDKLFNPPPQRRDESLLVRLYGRWMTQPTMFTVKVAGETKPRLDEFCAALQPSTVVLQQVDLTDAARRTPQVHSLFNSAVVRDFSPALATVEIRTPMRPARGLVELSKRFEQYGWEVALVEAGTRVSVTRAGAPGG